jgi:hypothetical protein
MEDRQLVGEVVEYRGAIAEAVPDDWSPLGSRFLETNDPVHVLSAVVVYVVPDAEGVGLKSIEFRLERVEVASSPLTLQLHTV